MFNLGFLVTLGFYTTALAVADLNG